METDNDMDTEPDIKQYNKRYNKPDFKSGQKSGEDAGPDHLPEWYRKTTLVLGCGNPLMGDDGFGSAVIKVLREGKIPGKIPEDVYVMDVETSARKILFPMTIGDTPVKRLIIIDAVDMEDKGRKPGEVFELPLDDIPFLKMDDFSMHQVPSSNLLKEMEVRRKIKVIILACQVESIPDLVHQGLSAPVRDAIPRMCKLVSSYWR
jgi:coenzyme F420 hydrogenase subunit delta